MKLRIPAPPLLAGGDEVPEDVQASLATALFEQHGSLIASLLAITMTGVSTAWGVREIWPLWWAAAAFPIFAYRFWLAWYFKRKATGNWRNWTYAFACGAWITAALWGVAGTFAIGTTDCFIRFVVLTVEATFISASMARNNPSPATANGMVVIALFPILIAAGFYHTTFSATCACFALINTLASVTTVRHRSEQTLRLLLADRMQTQLLQRLESANQQLATMSSTDSLTRLLNRRGFDQALADSWNHCLEHGTPLSVLMVDVDLFKQFNDRYGHIVGDECLRRTAAAVDSAVRVGMDLAARYGGEEFSVILPDTTSEQARVIGERLREAVETMAIPHQSSPYGCVSVSVGIGCVIPSARSSASELLVEADKSLYSAKALGRNTLGPVTSTLALL